MLKESFDSLVKDVGFVKQYNNFYRITFDTEDDIYVHWKDDKVWVNSSHCDTIEEVYVKILIYLNGEASSLCNSIKTLENQLEGVVEKRNLLHKWFNKQ